MLKFQDPPEQLHSETKASSTPQRRQPQELTCRLSEAKSGPTAITAHCLQNNLIYFEILQMFSCHYNRNYIKSLMSLSKTTKAVYYYDLCMLIAWLQHWNKVYYRKSCSRTQRTVVALENVDSIKKRKTNFSFGLTSAFVSTPESNCNKTWNYLISIGHHRYCQFFSIIG